MIKIKRNCVGLVLILVFTLVMSIIPIYAATSNWSFSMDWDGRYVNGSDNGVYHKLDAGGVKITGLVQNTYSRPGALGPNKLYFELLNKTSGNSFGTVTMTPQADGSKSFTGTFSSVGGGTKYYLVIYRTADDGRRMSGSGSLANI